MPKFINPPKGIAEKGNVLDKAIAFLVMLLYFIAMFIALCLVIVSLYAIVRVILMNLSIALIMLIILGLVFMYHKKTNEKALLHFQPETYVSVIGFILIILLYVFRKDLNYELPPGLHSLF